MCPYKVSQIFDLPGGYVKAFGEGQSYILHDITSLSQLTLAYIMLCRHKKVVGFLAA